MDETVTLHMYFSSLLQVVCSNNLIIGTHRQSGKKHEKPLSGYENLPNFLRLFLETP